MGALKPSEQYEVVHKLVTTTSADEQLLVLEALLADCHADTRMPLLARLAANVPLEQRLKALLGDGHDGERAQLLLQVTASLPSGERTACWAEALGQLRPAEQQELLTRLLQGQPAATASPTRSWGSRPSRAPPSCSPPTARPSASMA